jgi:hypothetical protein
MLHDERPTKTRARELLERKKITHKQPAIETQRNKNANRYHHHSQPGNETRLDGPVIAYKGCPNLVSNFKNTSAF